MIYRAAGSAANFLPGKISRFKRGKQKRPVRHPEAIAFFK